MNNKTRLERIKDAITEMREISEDGGIVIVEGRKDEASLSDLGVKNCLRLPLNVSIFTFSEFIAKQNRNVIIMTDWDDKGEELAKKIDNNLKNLDVLPDLNIRKRIKELVCKDIKDVESLNRYLIKKVYKEFGITTEQFL
ncbi:MAG TPA: toprim domain-containing protein [Halobacteria archaeon]|nr:toprim domain-containing protein [Halobacteria archaeon]